MASQVQQNRPVNRPRAKSGFSLRTSSSGSNSYTRGNLQETAAEKNKAKMSSSTKANPNAAINEAQPIALALEKPTISSLLNIQCADVYGNPITDPDRSNPTRWRMERPLDTIRAFEHAIDRGYSHRTSVYGPPQSAAPNNGLQSQRSSGFWNNQQQGNGYDPNGRFSNFSANGDFSPQRSANPRMQSDPMLNRYNPNQPGYQGQNAYAMGGEVQSPDGQQYSYSPQEGHVQDENAYGQRPHPPRFASQQTPNASAPQLGNYGYGNPQQQQQGGNGAYYQSNPNLVQQQQMPRPPPKDGRPVAAAKAPIRLNDPSPAQQKSDQRQSWLKKRFSRAK